MPRPFACSVVALTLLATGVPGLAAEPAEIWVVSDGRSEDEAMLAAVAAALTELGVPPVKMVPGELAATPTTARAVLALGPVSAQRVRLRRRAPPAVAVGLMAVGKPLPVNGVSSGWTHDVTAGLPLLRRLGGTGSPVLLASTGSVASTKRAAIQPVSTAPTGELKLRPVLLGEFPDRGAVAKQLTRAGALVYDALGASLVDKGLAVAGRAAAPALSEVAKWTAVQLQRVLERRTAAVIADLRNQPKRSSLNLTVAQRVAASVPLSLIAEARLFTRSQASGKALSMTAAVKFGLKRSLQVRASQLALVGSDARVSGAMATLLPSLGVSLGGTLIDSDAARASAGANPQFTLDFKASISQLLYSEQAWLAYSQAKLDRKAVGHDHASTLLDVVLAVSRAWLEVQRATAVVEVNRGLLELSRDNRRLAVGRKRAGTGTRADILRWDSQIATDAAGLMDAILTLVTAQITLSEVLGVPPSERVTLAQPSHEQLATETGSALMRGAMDDLLASRRVETALLAQALKADPELQRLAVLETTQQETIAATTREMFIPAMGVSAGLVQRVADAGVGKPPSVLPPGTPDDTGFFVTFDISLPLFDGGARYATLDGARAETQRLKVAVASRRLAVDRQLRQAFVASSLAFTKVDLHQKARDAAVESLSMTARQYARGATGIAPVLDAQAQQRRTELSLVNQRFAAEDALLGVYRQVSAFYFLLTPQEQAQWQTRLNRALRTTSTPSPETK